MASTGARPLRELWDRPLSAASAVPASSVPLPSSAELSRHAQDAHRWRMVSIFGDRASNTPPSAAHVFCSCGVIEGGFLCVNAITFSPLIFEICMPFHLKYTSLVIGWWGGTYIGLNVARYGPVSSSAWVVVRYAAGAALLTAGVASLILADGIPGQATGPWPSYWLLVAAYTGMTGVDYLLHERRMIPPWLLKWKLGLSTIIVVSLLLGVLKGRWLESNAQRLIMEAAALPED
eukprot:gnl/TRDRNA2_/TRDRNA2_196763_c0_seq1.p1 gnl/TRDRNA2_/TRDRNA2_196763_c0~~gnl/TRDRNA2_/TRDRNA2_196763_c0_seq1.p1  ORF type:complete len:266 (+),score=20.34 gnl/TRDRNA2_/TRDRNA2_196763_c0_seq1:98-799(+)